MMSWTTKERRRFVRVKLPCRIIVRVFPQQVIDSCTEDIGAGGVRIILGRELKIRSIVGLQIFLGSSNNEVVTCEGRIVWVVKRPEAKQKSGYDTGIEFFEMKEEDRDIIKNIVASIYCGKR